MWHPGVQFGIKTSNPSAKKCIAHQPSYEQRRRHKGRLRPALDAATFLYIADIASISQRPHSYLTPDQNHHRHKMQSAGVKMLVAATLIGLSAADWSVLIGSVRVIKTWLTYGN